MAGFDNVMNFYGNNTCNMHHNMQYANITSGSVDHNAQMVWQQSAQLPYVNNCYNYSQNNAYNAQAPTNRNPGDFNTFRQQASVADWEAYLYSPSANQVSNKTQNSVIVAKDEVPVSATSVAPMTNHHAHISFVHASDGVLKPIVKRKRKRTAFTTEQVQELEKVFHKRPYVSQEERQLLTNKLQVSDKAVKVWFQNRRLKVKKEKEERESSDSDVQFVQETKPLAYVEAQMCKPDKFGYVTLDERAITELVQVIDNLLPKDIDLSELDTGSEESGSVNSSVAETTSSTIYEPISPPDLSEESTTDFSTQQWPSSSSSSSASHSQWSSLESNYTEKSLQNLFDICIYR